MNKKILIIVTVCFLILIPLFLFILSSTSEAPIADKENEPNISLDSEELTDGEPGMIPGSRPQPSIESLIPHTTTAIEVRRELGIPKKTVDKQAYSIMYYTLEKTDRTNKVYIENNTVDYTIEQILIDNQIYKDYLAESENKKPNGVLYNLYENNAGFDLYVFSEDGIAFLVNEPTSYVAEIHRFAPTVYQVFFSTLAPRLTFQ